MRFGISLDQSQAELLMSALQNHVTISQILAKDIQNQIVAQAQAVLTPPPIVANGAGDAPVQQMNGHAQE